MNQRKHQNSIIVLATLGVYLGLALTGAAANAWAQAEPATDVLIDKRPIKELGLSIKGKLESKELDLTAPFLVECKSALGKDGRLVPKTVKFVRTEGDRKMVEIANQAIRAVSESGYFAYFRDLGVGEVSVLVKQDASEFALSISAMVATEVRAKTIALLLDTAITSFKHRKDNGKTDHDDLLWLNGMLVTSAEREVTVSSVLPKAAFHDMITRKLADR